MKECSTPPSEAVAWTVSWPAFSEVDLSMQRASTTRVGRTAWDAWSKCPYAPAFGSCRVQRTEDPICPRCEECCLSEMMTAPFGSYCFRCSFTVPEVQSEAEFKRYIDEERNSKLIQPKTAAKQET